MPSAPEITDRQANGPDTESTTPDPASASAEQTPARAVHTGSEALAADLDAAARTLDPTARLRSAREHIDGPLVFTSSLGLEDQVLLHLIARAGLDISVATLDTGRLFPETYDLWARTERTYSIRIEAFTPAAAPLERLVAGQGINGFYDSKQARLACCGVRKMEPLGRALSGAAGWVTGLRADQSANRATMRFVEWDPERRLIKVNPLLDWTRARIAAFAQAEGVPVSPLHERGFLSIGCAPCTRAIAPGEPERAGRWWWEQDDTKECGLHVGVDGRLQRVRTP